MFGGIGLIGLDSSHVSQFTEILNNSSYPYHVHGGNILYAWPRDPSLDFELSWGRVNQYTNELREIWGIHILDSPEAVAEASEAIMITSVDGRVHADLFKRIAHYRKPIFIDKPMAVSLTDARRIAQIAKKYDIPLMSCSSLRYAEVLNEALSNHEHGRIVGADCYGPIWFEPFLPSYFWYGLDSWESSSAFAIWCYHS
jgi:predicted dehydrogenase